MYVSFKQVNGATRDVQRDLFKSGFWYEQTRLNQATVYWTRMPSKDASGLFCHGLGMLDRIAGLKQGHIFIPAITMVHLMRSRTSISLRDVIRHEYGHAFAHYYPELIIRSKEFSKVFSGNYYSAQPSAIYDAASYVSQYAQSCPMEDFAETFMVFVRRHGRPIEKMNDRLMAKWSFIEGLRMKV
jgi:hypothetical protein